MADPAELPDGSAVAQHLGADVTVLLLGSPPPPVGAFVDWALARHRAVKVVRVPQPGAESPWRARVVVLDGSGEVRWRGDQPPTQLSDVDGVAPEDLSRPGPT